MPRKNHGQGGQLGLRQGIDVTGSGKALAPKYLPTGSGNPSQPFESHCRERLPPEALVS